MNTAKQNHLVRPDSRFGTRPIRTFLAAESRLTMAFLARVLSKYERIIIVAATTDGWKVLCKASTLHPDYESMDFEKTGLDGAEVRHRLKQLPNPPVIVVVTPDESPVARNRCMTSGADAFLVKTVDLSSQLREAIHQWYEQCAGPTLTKQLP